LVGAGLFIRTLSNLRAQEMGFDREHVSLIWTAPSHVGLQGQPVAQLFANALERVSTIPGVRSVGAASNGLMSEGIPASPAWVPGYTYGATEDNWVQWNLVDPRFFDTVGMRVVLGRGFTDRDTESSQSVGVINETMARYYFGNQNPIGCKFGMRRDTVGTIEIVGVVRDAKYNSLREKNVRMIYRPYRQDTDHLWDMCIAVRTADSTPSVLAGIRKTL